VVAVEEAQKIEDIREDPEEEQATLVWQVPGGDSLDQISKGIPADPFLMYLAVAGPGNKVKMEQAIAQLLAVIPEEVEMAYLL
jgi:hypothetical protein